MESSWDESLETDNVIIDSQHRQLINLLDEVADGFQSHSEVLRMFDKAMEFTITHFLCEEELMTEVDYPSDARKTMLEQHKEFKHYLQLRILEFRESEKLSVPPLQSFIVNFLKVHEFEVDRQLADWIRRQTKTRKAS